MFAELLTEDPGVQAAHVPLVAHRDAAAGEHQVVALGGAVEELMAAVREAEADDVAAMVQQIVADRWPVRDVRSGEVRPATAHDIALLIPSRTVLPALESALRAS